LTYYHHHHHIKDEMDGSCSMHETRWEMCIIFWSRKCVFYFGRQTRREETTPKTLA